MWTFPSPICSFTFQRIAASNRHSLSWTELAVPWHWVGAGRGGAGPEHYTTELLWHKYSPHGQVQATNSLTTSSPSPWSLNNRLLQAGTNQLQHNTEKDTVENMKSNPGPSITGLSTESLTTSSNVCLILCWQAARESKSVYPRLPVCVHWRINLPIRGALNMGTSTYMKTVIMNLEMFLLHAKQTSPDYSIATLHIKSKTVPPSKMNTKCFVGNITKTWWNETITSFVLNTVFLTLS